MTPSTLISLNQTKLNLAERILKKRKREKKEERKRKAKKQKILVFLVEKKIINFILKIAGCLFIYGWFFFANGPGDQGSILGRVIPKTQKMLALHSAL